MHTYSVLCLFIMFYIYIQKINKLKTEYVLFSFAKQYADYWFTNVLIRYLIYTFKMLKNVNTEYLTSEKTLNFKC